MPALVIIVLCYIWIGLVETAVVVAVALNKIPNVVVTVREGARALDQSLLEMAASFRIGKRKTFTKVILPQLYPYLAAAARSGLALIWKIVLGTELLGSSSGVGFKILLDILASARRPLRFTEVPYTFRERHAGESKLDSVVAWEYLMMLLDKTVGRFMPVRFVAFAAVGALGVIVHMAVLALVFQGIYAGAESKFGIGQALATLVAMTFNFFVNNALTYRDRRLRGRALIRGWVSFTAACSLGAIANVGIAVYLFSSDTLVGIGWVLSAMAGIVVGAVWNYAVTSVYTWNQPKYS